MLRKGVRYIIIALAIAAGIIMLNTQAVSYTHLTLPTTERL